MTEKQYKDIMFSIHIVIVGVWGTFGMLLSHVIHSALR